MNVDRAIALDGKTTITDIRSIGTVMIEMLTRTKIGNAEQLKLPADRLFYPPESYRGCIEFLQLASRKEKNLKSYLGLLLLLVTQLSNWESTDNRLERSRELSFEVGVKQPSVL